eukprot:16901-Hanusia_phi.AAC.2
MAQCHPAESSCTHPTHLPRNFDYPHLIQILQEPPHISSVREPGPGTSGGTTEVPRVITDLYQRRNTIGVGGI